MALPVCVRRSLFALVEAQRPKKKHHSRKQTHKELWTGLKQEVKKNYITSNNNNNSRKRSVKAYGRVSESEA